MPAPVFPVGAKQMPILHATAGACCQGGVGVRVLLSGLLRTLAVLQRDDPDPDQQLVLRSMQLKKNGKPRKNNRTIPGWAGRQGYDMLPCPHMSLLEWTRAWGNLYVAELSGYNLELAAANPTTASAEWCSADHW